MIKDDGVGMDEETIQSLLNTGNFNGAPASGGYAVGNVNERLKLIFNDSYSLKYTSSPGNGTEVEILIPAVEYHEEQEDGQ